MMNFDAAAAYCTKLRPIQPFWPQFIFGIAVLTLMTTLKVSGHSVSDSNVSIDIYLQDVWDMLWSEDSPDLFAMMEKGRMYIFRCAAWQSSWVLSVNDVCLCVGSSVHDHLDLQLVAQIVEESFLCAALTAAHHAHPSESCPCLSVCDAYSPMICPQLLP